MQDDFDLNWYAFKWRNHDPAIGRFFNVDPLAMDYVYNSPYAFSENQVVAHVELEGLEKAKINTEGDVILPASDHHRINEEYIDEEFKDLHPVEPGSLPDLSLEINVTVGPQAGVKVGNLVEADLTVGNIEVLKDETQLKDGEISSKKQLGTLTATPEEGVNNNGTMKVENSVALQVLGFGGKIGQKQYIDGDGHSSGYNTFTEGSVNYGGFSGTVIKETDKSGNTTVKEESSFTVGLKFILGVELKFKAE